MRLNSVGSALYGATSVYINGVIPTSLGGGTGGRWVWMTDDLIGGQMDFGGGFGINTVIVSTDTLTNIDSVGASSVAGGGGLLLAYLAGPPIPGVRVTVGGTWGPFPTSSLGDTSPEGLTALIKNAAAGSGIITYNAIGAQLNVQSVALSSTAISAKSGLYSYRDASGMHLRSLTTGVLQSYAPRTGDTTFQCVPIVMGGTTYVVEAVGAGVSTLSLRPATSSNGFLIETGDTFNVDVCSPSAGVIRIGWCINAGESQTSLRMADITLATGGVTNWTTTSGTLVSSAGTPIPSSPFVVGPVEGGSTSATKQPRKAMKADGSGFVGAGGVRQYQAWWDTLAGQAVAPPNLSQATGVLPPAQGGTGGSTGLTVLDGGNVVQNTTQLDTAQVFGPYVLADGRNLILTNPLTVSTYVQLNGSANLRVV